MLTIAVLGTFDTKGEEHAFIAECIQKRGHRPLLIDIGTGGPPTIVPDITRDEVLLAMGSVHDKLTIGLSVDRGRAVDRMAKAIPLCIKPLVDRRSIQGIIALGGSGGTAIATAAMRALPIGFPKVMVSTMAGGNVSQYVGVSDLLLFPSLVDVAGLNRISRGVFQRAAATVMAMAEANATYRSPESEKPLVVASMFGNTTRCVEYARRLLEGAGYEVIVFHATGSGGRTMEALIASGLVQGVLDVTTTEWADELMGGVMPGGPHRLEAAARSGVPAVIAPGCLDMVNFGEPHSVPEHYRNRRFYQHNPQVTLMRTTPEECCELGRTIASKINQSTGDVRFLFPRKAISVISAEGQPFHDPDADESLWRSLRDSLRKDIPLISMECEINDPEFAEACASQLLDAMRSSRKDGFV